MGFISFGGKTENVDVRPEKIYKSEDFKREISALYDKHAQEIRELDATFLRDMADAGAASFQEARNNIDSTVEHFTGFKNTAYMIYLRAYDLVSKEDGHLDKYIAQKLAPSIIRPCTAGSAAIHEILKNYLHNLQAKNNAFNAEIAQKLNQIPAGSKEADEAKKFAADMEKISKDITTLVEKKIWLSIGIAIDAVFCKELAAALINVAGKIIGRVVTNVAITIADGPLPIGDIIAVLGMAWCAWDIYQVQKVLPDKLRNSIRQAIDKCESEARNSAYDIARNARKICLNSSRQAVEALAR